MTADLIIKNANVFMTYRQCFEKRDVAVAASGHKGRSDSDYRNF